MTSQVPGIVRQIKLVNVHGWATQAACTPRNLQRGNHSEHRGKEQLLSDTGTQKLQPGQARRTTCKTFALWHNDSQCAANETARYQA
jgi:hypothetical protein